MKSSLVIFDLISTLTDAGPRYVQAFAKVCEDAGYTAPEAETLLGMLGDKNLSEITDRFAPGLDPQQKQAFMGNCNKACDALLNRDDWHEKLYPHVREAAETLRLRGHALGIFTGTREDAMHNQLAYHGIEHLFDAEYLRGKDNARDAGKKSEALKTEQLTAIAGAFRKDTNNANAPAVVIGDSESDAKAAASLGFSFIGFAANETKRKKLALAGVTLIFTDFADLPDMVERLLRPPANDAAKPAPPNRARKPKP